VRKWTQFHIRDNWNYAQHTYPSKDVRISGDLCPFVQWDALKTYANEIRKFTERDLVIKANAPDFDGAVFLAELDETVREIYRILLAPIEMLAKARAVKKRGRAFNKRKPSFLDLPLNPEEVWLWVRYFLMPAMMDAEDLLKAMSGFPKIDRVQAGSRSEGWIDHSGSCVYNWLYSRPVNISWQGKYKYGTGGAIDIHHRSDPNNFGTQPWDVVRAAWERTPWSFVFDWFVNVGDWLASLREIELSVAQSYASIAIEAETKVTLENSGAVYTDVNPVTYNSLYISRIIDIEPPTFPLVDKRWNNITRSIDLISLALATIKRIAK
jgi:hypothetical protein